MCKKISCGIMKSKFKKVCTSNSREAEHNLLKMEKNSCNNVQENLKLAMKKVG